MSGSSGVVRKVFDISPKAITSNGNFNGSGAPTTAWSAGFTTGEWLTSIPQSVNDNGRVGISVAAETLDIRLRITPDNTVVGHQHLRMIILADNECDGATPSTAEFLGDTNSTVYSLNTGVDLAFLQPAYFGRFHIYEDRHWIWYNSSTQNSFQETCTHPPWHEVHFDLRDHRLMWDTTDGNSITSARRGHIFMFFQFSNMTTATGGLPTLTTANPPTIQYASRLRYRDA